MTETHFGLEMIAVVGTKLTPFLDVATYHNFYSQFKHQLPNICTIIKIKDNKSDQINDCIKFMKHNPSATCIQAIMAIYCNKHGIRNWNKNDETIHFYNNFLNDLNAAKFDSDNILDALQLVDSNENEQKKMRDSIYPDTFDEQKDIPFICLCHEAIGSSKIA